MKGVARATWMWPAILAWLGLQACDAPFEPFEKTGRMSVFGALDATADTQWIRVTPIRQTVLMSPDQIAMTVTLERMGTGRTVALRDSIVRFETGTPSTPEAEWFTHNFWTTEPIESGATYVVTVTGADRSTASMTVAIPEDFTVIVGYSPTPGIRPTLRTEGAEHLGVVLGHLYFAPDCVVRTGIREYYLSLPSVVPPPVSPAVYELLAPPTSTRDEEFYPCPVVHREIFVAASGSPWPKGLQNATSALGVPYAPSNVGNGIGFVAGVRTRSFQREPCNLEPRTGPCLLTYDSKSVTLQGTVRDRLTGTLLPGATLRLTEIIPGSSPPTSLRGTTDAQGSFELGAVEPGVSHVFRVGHNAHCWGNGLAPLVFLDQIDTLPAYAPAERVAVEDVVLQRNPDPGCANYVYPLE